MKEVKVFHNLSDLSEACAQFIYKEMKNGLKRRGNVNCVLSGGHTPGLCYQHLASLLTSESGLVNHTHWFIGDERWVPFHHSASNAGLIHKLLFTSLDVPEEQVYTWHACEKDKFKCAQEYNQLIETRFIEQDSGADILLLGLGDDGHTASLFPDAKILSLEGEYEQISPDIHQNAVAVWVSKMETWRLTLTPRFFNRAGCIIFLISGSQKQESFQKILKGDDSLPASWITGKNVYYFVTRDLLEETIVKEKMLENKKTWPVTIPLQN